MMRVSPEMLAAWVDYEPAHDLTPPVRYSLMLGAIRHAFYAGWAARDSGSDPQGEKPSGFEGEASQSGGEAASPNPNPQDQTQ